MAINSNQYNVRHYQIEDKSIDFDRKLQVLIQYLKEFIAGKRGLDSVKAAVHYEVSANGNLHAHVIVALIGETTRSIDDVQNFITRKWKKLRSNDDIRNYKTMLTEKQKMFQRWIGIGRGGNKFPWEQMDVPMDSRSRR
jgi:hypothetical protein